ncbi:MAG TPA: HupE/UreJ family protein, partial [Polyangiales bacterium]
EVEAARLPAALVGFNLGVELGQVAFIAAVLLIERLMPAAARVRLGRLRLAAQYALGGLAMYWFFDRVAQLVVSA